MRGTVSAGMAPALHELGLLPLFGAVYGASAGAISAAWLLSSRPEGLHGWAEPAFARAMIRRRNVLLGRPLVNVRRLVEVLYRGDFPLDYASVLASAVEFHPLATDVVTGAAVDLRSRVSDEATLRLALRASAALPLPAGGPVRLGGRAYYDAGLAESIPFRQTLRDGATHVLVLRSRRPADRARAAARPSRGDRLIAGVGLRAYSPELRATFLSRDVRLDRDDRLLAEHDLDEAALGPAVMSVRPYDSAPYIGRLETDGALLRAAFEAGRAALTDKMAGLGIA
ncbi:patatin-like phospholipase family protein [Actinomadura sp. DC4]|uniref:patatin-like phospholipase family protein n=1 Tax=Actinomadura sp. DC4 TaxID=3055069 RepID=UPI0025B13136|nr:patatin-like phospholipase family protein [Actinomadura sp. DC4]MDN3352554.1 patatin-like phospholipase family protein [Actinomadura sp. DC4]